MFPDEHFMDQALQLYIFLLLWLGKFRWHIAVGVLFGTHGHGTPESCVPLVPVFVPGSLRASLQGNPGFCLYLFLSYTSLSLALCSHKSAVLSQDAHSSNAAHRADSVKKALLNLMRLNVMRGIFEGHRCDSIVMSSLSLVVGPCVRAYVLLICG